MSVSIPYSSGLGLERFSWYDFLPKGESCVSIPYSSGLGLEQCTYAHPGSAVVIVSIPYSSGLGLEQNNHSLRIEGDSCLNPLFIRSRFGTRKLEKLEGIAKLLGVSIPYSSGLGLERLSWYTGLHQVCLVSIPYSSGLGLERRNS